MACQAARLQQGRRPTIQDIVYRDGDGSDCKIVLGHTQCSTEGSCDEQEVLLPPPHTSALTVAKRVDWETEGSVRSAGSCGFALGPGWGQSVRTCCWKTGLAGCGIQREIKILVRSQRLMR